MMNTVQSNEPRLSSDSGVSSVDSESDVSPVLGPEFSLVLSSTPASMEGQSPTRKAKKRPPPLPEIESFHVLYLGNLMLDRRYTQPMLPWVMSEIRRKHVLRPIQLQVLSNSLRAVADNDSVDPLNPCEIVFEHKLQTLTRFARAHLDLCCFAYLTRTSTDAPFCCFVFEAYSAEKVKELFNAIRIATKEAVKEHNKDKPACEMKPGSHFYEVLYTGKVIVAHKKAPPTFIDDSVDKFQAHELERRHKLEVDHHSEPRHRHNSGASTQSLPGYLENSVFIKENELPLQSPRDSVDSNQGSDTPRSGHSEENLDHHSSTEALDKSDFISKSDDSLEKKIDSSPIVEGKKCKDSENLKKSIGSDTGNKTMIFQISNLDISFISLDKKSVILERKFKDISFCSQGTRHAEHFGFISRDPKSQKLICYIFRCASESVVTEIMQSLKMAFHNAFQQSAKNHVVCEQCPMHQLHKLCQEIDGHTAEKVFEVIKSRIEGLQESDYTEVITRLKSDNPQTHQEMNEVMMTQLRILCEARQKEHVHISDANRNELRNEFNLSGIKTSKFDILKSKAKKSLATSFENFFTRPKRDEQKIKDSNANEPENNLAIEFKDTPEPSPCTSPIAKTFNEIHDLFPQLDDSPRHQLPHLTRPRSSTVGDTPVDRRPSLPAPNTMDIKLDRGDDHKPPISNVKRGSKLYMLSKAGETMPDFEAKREARNPLLRSSSVATPIRRRGSWRQAIFNRVVTPVRHQDPPITESGEEYGVSTAEVGRLHTSESIRALWRKAIMETLLLIRMEKENHNLQAHQDEVESLRVMLDYEEITPCLKEVTKRWDAMLIDPALKTDELDRKKLIDTVKSGVPRRKRGEIWDFLIQQHRLHNPGAQKLQEGIDSSVSFHDLLKQLTTHQHSILIDLGRTFPSHPYFSGQTGAGQLALFNLLKAYSLLDKEVGYCQGLSFVAGFLLMHLPEESSFEMFKYIMFQLGFRRQYRPDMVALQIQMYQLSRLLHDRHKDLYEHFESHEIVPTLYAAPWFLTLYASQFPLGFVARVFDLILIFGMEVIFKVALVLLGNHRELIMQCDSFESIVDFLKTTLPEMGIIQMERVFNQVFTLDITQELKAYEVEYHVLQEEMVCSPQKGEDELPQKLEIANQNLKRQNMELIEQLRTAHNLSHSHEQTIQSLQTSHGKLRQHVRTLELERSALLSMVTRLKKLVPEHVLAEHDTDIPPMSPSFDTLSKFSEFKHHVKHDHEVGEMNKKSHRSGSAEDADLEVAKYYRNISSPSSIGGGDGGSVNIDNVRHKHLLHVKQQPLRPLSNPK